MLSYDVLQVLYERPCLKVLRCVCKDGSAVIVKRLSNDAIPDVLARLQHEYELLNNIDLPYVIKTLGLEKTKDDLELMLEDIEGDSLEHILGSNDKLTLEQFFNLAILLTETLAGLHKLNIIHNAISPAHIIFNALTGDFRLIGFGQAGEQAQQNTAIQLPLELKDALAYISPEQTGRMNRVVDYRTDFYSLGAAFYRFLTGKPPFLVEDVLGLIHCHIAVEPVPPNFCVDGIPKPVSDIVMKLLEKTPKDRYQTAEGLKADLGRCAVEWQKQGKIVPFQLGTRDLTDRLLIPDKLYGRDREIETLLNAFNSVIINGKTRLMLISGYSGVGKSAVVNELNKTFVSSHGLFASGKFDQYNQGVPYSTLAQAFDKLIQMLLGKSEAELDRWRQDFQAAVEPNGKLITDMVPSIHLIIGDQPPVPELEPIRAKARYQLVLRRFISVFARSEHPLTLFIDDLQWLDAATLDIIEDLLIQEDTGYLFLIGAYRDNEVTPDHLLMRKLDVIRKAGVAVDEIPLSPLILPDLTQLMADSLHCELKQIEPLAQLIYGKTAGNPFFIVQFLSALTDEGLVSFDHTADQWSWDLSRIHAKDYTDNVADLMAAKLTRLPTKTLIAMQQLACLGNAADTNTLSFVFEVPEEDVYSVLQEGVRQEFLLRDDNVYRFIHDRIQEVAYALIPVSSRADIHRKIGMRILEHTPQERLEESIFEIVNQLNRGPLITEYIERDQLAELNLIAGKRAKEAAAYTSALIYLNTGSNLLVEEDWERRHELKFALEMNLSECEYLTGQLLNADERLTALSNHATGLVEQSIVACLRTDVCTTLDMSGCAIAICLEYLEHVGIKWSHHPISEELRCEYERVEALLAGRTIDDLIDLPLMTNPESLATIEVLIKLWPAALFTDANLASLTICKAVGLSLELGNCSASCFAYALLGRMAGPSFGDYQTGFRYGQLGYELVEQRGLKRYEARTYLCFANSVMPWMKHIHLCRDLERRAFDSANKAGDLLYGGFACNSLNTNLLFAGDPLSQVQIEAELALAFAQKARFGLVINSIAAQLALIRNLRGFTQKFGCFDDDHFNEMRIEHQLHSNSALAIAACRYWIRKLQARYFAADYPAAIDAAMKAQDLLWTSPLAFEEAEYHFYSALAHAAYINCIPDCDRSHYLGVIDAHHKQLQIWAANCPENFENRAALVGAEIMRLEGRDIDAMRLYEKAVESARTNGFVHNEALTYELAAAFYRQRGFEDFARVYLTKAVACYNAWEAEGKVRQLVSIYTWLEQTRKPESSTLLERLDAVSIAKAQQAISSEFLMESLAHTLLRIVMENAGAQSGYLALEDGNELWAVMSHGTDDSQYISFNSSIPSRNIPASILNYVRRTRETVVLADARVDSGQFLTDQYIQETKPKSVLCMAIQRQENLLGVLYLENNLVTNAFTPERRIVLEVLASQSAITLQTAGLYKALKESETKYRRIVDTAIEGIIIIAPDNRTIQFVNDRMANLLGYTPEQILNRELTDFMFTDDILDYQQKMEKRSKGVSEQFQRRFKRKDGQSVWVLASATPIYDDNQNYQGSFAMLTDISERIRAEEEIRNLNQDLELRVIERTEKLEIANKELEAFAYTVSHDLRAPLRHINGFIELLANETSGSINVKGKNYMNRIIDSSKRMETLIDDLLSFSRMGRQEMSHQDVNFTVLVHDIVNELAGDITNRTIKWQIGELPIVTGDYSLLRIAMVNLISNAVKYTQYCDTTLIEIGHTLQESQNVIYIKDNGVGFDPKYATRLFGVFQRLHRMEDFKGTGIGLANVRRIIERHGGKTWAEGKPNEGAVFYFSLPI